MTVGLKDGFSIKSQELARACTVAEYFKFENSARGELMALYEKYLNWCRSFDEGFEDLPELLEDPVRV